MFKKTIFLVFMLVIVLVISGITKSPELMAAQLNIRIGTSSVGGGWYPHGGAMAVVFEKYIPEVSTAVSVSTAGPRENLEMLRTGQFQLVFMSPTDAYMIYHDEKNYEGLEYKGLRHLFAINTTPNHFITRKGSGIKDIKDLKGKRIATGTIGSGEYLFEKAVLKAAGLTEEDVILRRLDRNGRRDALVDGRVDVAIFSISLGAASVEDLTASIDTEFIDIKKDQIDIIIEMHPYYTETRIPAGSYANLDRDVQTFGHASFIAVDESLNKDFAYKFTKTYFEYHDEVKMMYEVAGRVQFENAAAGNVVPIHEGAKEYFKERGLID